MKKIALVLMALCIGFGNLIAQTTDTVATTTQGIAIDVTSPPSNEGMLVYAIVMLVVFVAIMMFFFYKTSTKKAV